MSKSKSISKSMFISISKTMSKPMYIAMSQSMPIFMSTLISKPISMSMSKVYGAKKNELYENIKNFSFFKKKNFLHS